MFGLIGRAIKGAVGKGAKKAGGLGKTALQSLRAGADSDRNMGERIQDGARGAMGRPPLQRRRTQPEQRTPSKFGTGFKSKFGSSKSSY
jgi:hypothetical protein